MSAIDLIETLKIQKKISIYGAGKMALQTFACLRNLKGVEVVEKFIVTSDGPEIFMGKKVAKLNALRSLQGECVIVAVSRSFHPQIRQSLDPLQPETVIFLSGEALEGLKKAAFEAMCENIGIDLNLIGAMTNDYIWSSIMLKGESYNGSIRKKIFDISLESSANFVITNMPSAISFDDVWEYRSFLMQEAAVDGYFLEFGVADGNTLDFWARKHPQLKFFGFDSFKGLPEDWKPGFKKGRFDQEILPKFPDNVNLVPGWFSETVSNFVAEYQEIDQISFIHIDCDLYSSTKTIFDNLGNLIKSGAIIAFDEYFNYPGWEGHEHKAFLEFCDKFHVNFDYIAYVENGNQVAVRIL